MTALIRAFAGIAMLRLEPSVLPASVVLLVLAGAGYAASNAFQQAIVFHDGHWLGRTLVDLAFTVAFFWLLLAVRGYSHRWNQVMTAIFGVAVLLSPLWIGLSLLLVYDGTPVLLKVLVAGAYFTVFAWLLLIIAHVLKAALEINLFASVAISVASAFANYWLVEWIYPAPAA